MLLVAVAAQSEMGACIFRAESPPLMTSQGHGTEPSAGFSMCQPVSCGAAWSLKSTVFISAGFHFSKAGTVPGT